MARESRHEFITVEHLLLSILDMPDVADVLNSCDGDIDLLKDDLLKFINSSTPTINEDKNHEVQPTLGFQRVLQRAVFHVQSAGKKEVVGNNVLVSIFGERNLKLYFY